MDDRLLIDARVLVRTEEFGELVFNAALVVKADDSFRAVLIDVVLDDNAVRRDRLDYSVALGDNDGAGVPGEFFFETGSNDGRIRRQQGDSLALHIRTHQSAVCVIVLEERDQCSSGADDLVRRNVHVLDFVGFGQRIITLEA